MAKANQENTRSYAVNARNYDFRAITVNASAIKGFQAAVVVDADGKVISQNNKSGEDIDLLTQAISGVCDIVNKGTKELVIGKFHTGEFDGPWGHIYISVLGDKTLITQCDKSAHGEDVLARLERIIEGCTKGS